ncbi:UDP-N-acetylmuramate--L-alanine ligase [bacterium]|nr:UDP-N-acetylmuramate--L-alanine ligase [bacterium]MBU1598762.1 UDP-N-acetylmuramate--L-alanine ligase [bacterium]MBU2462388.1 UDP-N-acetylmuramate--L-alanine ligase [bacterium]
MKKIHFVGIGGIGMSGIAEVMLNLGFSVSGSDLAESPITERLKGLGAIFYKGHSAGNLNFADTVVLSSAISYNNPEVSEARRRGISILARADLLAHIMEMREGIAVTGAHGKTTTTALISAILEEAGLSPTWINGGIIRISGMNARLGSGKYIVAEADESDGSFLKLKAKIVVVTNIDREHMDYFKEISTMKRLYLQFINQAELAILCSDCPQLKEIIPEIKTKYRTYGENGLLSARNIRVAEDFTEFDLIQDGDFLAKIQLGQIGRHNVQNALAAISVGKELEICDEIIKKALANFKGVDRRLHIKGEKNNIMVVEDYGHHPTEIKATLQAAKEAWKRRLIVVFQPHRYTRTRDCMDEFATSFGDADIVILTPIYPASEVPIPNVSSEKLAEAIAPFHKNIYLMSQKEEAVSVIKNKARAGDVILLLGAGDINKLAEQILEAL